VPSLITESWNGQRPLYKVFWLYYILSIFLVALALVLFVQIGPLLPELITFGLVFAIPCFIVLWKVWALVSIWRCAANASFFFYKFIARAYVLLFTLTIIGGAVEKIYEEYQQRSLPRAPRIVPAR
jgi:hypothetical protein